VAGQESLFGDMYESTNRKALPRQVYERPIIEWPGGVKPWDPIDAADTELGWQYLFVTPRRAVEIRQEIEHG
jgi:hypothetical protein